MPFREPTLSLRDIAAAIDAIMQFTHGMDFMTFRADAKTVAAVERKLQVVSALTGNEGALPNSFGLSLEQLADKMNTAKQEALEFSRVSNDRSCPMD